MISLLVTMWSLGECIYSVAIEDHPHQLEPIHTVSLGLVSSLVRDPTGLCIVPHTNTLHFQHPYHAKIKISPSQQETKEGEGGGQG